MMREKMYMDRLMKGCLGGKCFDKPSRIGG